MPTLWRAMSPLRWRGRRSTTRMASRAPARRRACAALPGQSPVGSLFPLVAGIDFAGTVISSDHASWKAGDKVILNGWGVGETHNGAYAGRARVKGDWLVPLPDGITGREAMAVGTAG